MISETTKVEKQDEDPTSKVEKQGEQPTFKFEKQEGEPARLQLKGVLKTEEEQGHPHFIPDVSAYSFAKRIACVSAAADHLQFLWKQLTPDEQEALSHRLRSEEGDEVGEHELHIDM